MKNLNDDKLYFHGYKIRIYPTVEQEEFINRCFEINDYVYNWALEQENKAYKDYLEGKSAVKFISEFDLDKMYSDMRNKTEWLKEIPLTVGRYAIRDLINGFNKFFDKGCNNKYPKFKSKKHRRKTHQSYHVRTDTMYFDDNLLRIEGLPRRTGKIFTKWHSGHTMGDGTQYRNCVLLKDNLGKIHFLWKKLNRSIVGDILTFHLYLNVQLFLLG